MEYCSLTYEQVLQFAPEAILSIADDLLDADVEADKKYAGWSPGSTSLIGFGREISLWERFLKDEKKVQKKWGGIPLKQLTSEFVNQRWREIVKHGLGDDFTDEKGHERVRELIGNSM